MIDSLINQLIIVQPIVAPKQRLRMGIYAGVVSFFYTLRGRKKSWRLSDRDRTRERHILNLEKDSHLERVLFNDQINL